jgi:hypothetical protein
MPHHDTLASETKQWVFHQPCSNHLTMHSMRLPPPTALTVPSRLLKANRWHRHEVQEMQSLLCVCNLQCCHDWPLPTVQLLPHCLVNIQYICPAWGTKFNGISISSGLGPWQERIVWANNTTCLCWPIVLERCSAGSVDIDEQVWCWGMIDG